MKKLTILTILLSFLSLGINAQIINIPEDYTTIQEGIDASSDGDTVLVQPGTYPENIVFNGKTIVVTSMFLFTADTADLNQTIIDGQWWDEVVQIINNEDSTTALIGFSIINGVRGILISGANASIYSCKIHDNSFPTDAGGGGIVINGCFPGMDYNVANIIGCEIYNNHCRHGGGISIANNRGIVEGCKIYNNTNYENGNQVQFWNTETIMRNCYIEDSQVEGFDVIEFRGGCKPILVNNIIVSNNVSGDEALFLSWEVSSPILINNTIINSSEQQGELITIYPPSHFTIYNSLAIGFHMNDGLGYTSAYNRFDNSVEGIGNITADPFINNDFSLSPCSPCIGTGTSSFTVNDTLYMAPEHDYFYNPRPNPNGTNPDMGAFESELWIPNNPVTITTQPIGTSLCQGESYTFSVEAEGTLEISYQWQKDEVDIPGAINPELSLNNILPDDQGFYTCVLSTNCGILISDTAYLRVFTAPSIIQQPKDIFAYEGDSAAFVPEVSGYEPLSYQWYGPDGILPGETSQYLQFPEIHFSDTGNYFCTVENTCASFQSENAHISVFQQLVADAGEDKYIHPMYSATLNANIQGGSQGIEYFWSPDTLVTDPFAMNTQTILLSTSQTLTFTVIDTIVGFQASDNMTVNVVWNDTTNINGFGNDTTYHFENGQQPCGYISGNNCDNDLIKAQYFYDELNLFEINEILIHFYKAVKTSEEEVPVRVGIWDNTGSENTPGALIASKNIMLSEIIDNTLNEEYSSVVFEEPVRAGNGYYIGVFLPQSDGDTVVISTNHDGQSEPNLAWTQKADFEWISYSQDPRWYLNVSNAIFPVVKQINLGIDNFLNSDKIYRVFPNPASNQISIIAQKQLSIESEVTILNTQGRNVYNTIFHDKAIISVDNLISGMYILNVKNDKHSEIHKIIIK